MPKPEKQQRKKKGVVIAATSDLHGYLEGIEQVCKDRDADILVIAGDIQPADIMYHCSDAACGHWFRNKFFKLMKKLKCEVVAIPGNHDFWLRSLLRGDFGPMEDCKKKFFIPDNFHLLCDSEITIKGLRIFGTPWVPYISGHWCYEAFEADLWDKFEKVPSGLDILVAHTPPRIKDKTIDVSLERDPDAKRPFGSLAMADTINKKKPLLTFCGHIHSGNHSTVGFYRTPQSSFVYNVSRVNERYFIEYPIKVIEVRKKVIVEDAPPSTPKESA